MDSNMDHHFQSNQDLVLQISENQTMQELEANRRAVAQYITALLRTINCTSEDVNGNQIQTVIKMISSLQDSCDVYKTYTRAMQHKR